MTGKLSQQAQQHDTRMPDATGDPRGVELESGVDHALVMHHGNDLASLMLATLAVLLTVVLLWAPVYLQRDVHARPVDRSTATGELHGAAAQGRLPLRYPSGGTSWRRFFCCWVTKMMLGNAGDLKHVLAHSTG